MEVPTSPKLQTTSIAIIATGRCCWSKFYSACNRHSKGALVWTAASLLASWGARGKCGLQNQPDARPKGKGRRPTAPPLRSPLSFASAVCRASKVERRGHWRTWLRSSLALPVTSPHFCPSRPAFLSQRFADVCSRAACRCSKVPHCGVRWLQHLLSTSLCISPCRLT